MTPIDMSDIACMKATLSQMMELMESIMATYSTQLATQSTTQPATQPAQQSNQSITQLVTQPVTQLATQPEHSVKQEEEQCSPENIAETVSSSSDTTGVLSTVSHQSTQLEQEEEPMQLANAENTAENTAEKASDNKATTIKNTAQLSKIPRTGLLSTIPRQIATQQAENDTTIWPAISTCLGNITLWYITAMTTQEKDLLRRSQPNHYG